MTSFVYIRVLCFDVSAENNQTALISMQPIWRLIFIFVAAIIFNNIWTYTRFDLIQNEDRTLFATSLSLNEATDMAQNRPLWRLMSMFGDALHS